MSRKSKIEWTEYESARKPAVMRIETPLMPSERFDEMMRGLDG